MTNSAKFTWNTPDSPQGDILLQIRDLHTSFYTHDGVVKAVDGVSFEVRRGEVLGLVGESGCGKSVTSLSILRLIAPPGKIDSGEILFEGRDLLELSTAEMTRMRGDRIAMIFQAAHVVAEPGVQGGRSDRGSPADSQGSV